MIEVTRLSKRYGNDKFALDDASFTLSEKAIVGLVGNNGSGKTTLINCLLGYILPTMGTVKIYGKCPNNREEISCKMLLVDEKMSYDPFLSLDRIIEKLKLFSYGFDEEICKKICNVYSLPQNRRYSKLSKGMKNQFNIAVGLATNREIIIFDEPVAGLDENARDVFYKLLLDEYIKNPRLMIVSTHLLAEMQNITSKLIVMRDGKVVCCEDTEAIGEKFIELIGRADNIRPILNAKKIYKENSLSYLSSIFIRNNLTRDEKKFLEEQNITISSLKPNEVCKIICNSDYSETVYNLEETKLNLTSEAESSPNSSIIKKQEDEK